jgi:segregation and condensation protein B
MLPAIIESIIFSSDAPMALDRLCEIIPEYGRDDIKSALGQICAFHDARFGGFILAEVAGGWQFRTRPDYHQFVIRQLKVKSTKFSQSSLESLAIVAYRQPITRAEVEHLRGVDCGGVMKTLLEKRLIRILGKKDIPGRPLIYGTTKEFLEIFGLKDLKGLPTLKEIMALDDMPLYERQEELPLENHSHPPEEVPLF